MLTALSVRVAPRLCGVSQRYHPSARQRVTLPAAGGTAPGRGRAAPHAPDRGISRRGRQAAVLNRETSWPSASALLDSCCADAAISCADAAVC